MPNTKAYGVANTGLTLIKTVSFSAVSSQSLNNIFSSTYDNYRIVFNATAASALTTNWRLRVGGTDDSGSNYTVQSGFFTGTGVSAARDSAITNWNWLVVRTTLSSPMVFDILNPAKASPTTALTAAVDIGDPSYRASIGIHNQNTAYDGINIICSTSNMTGSVSVYGYNK